MVWLRWHCWVGFFGHQELVGEEQRRVGTWAWVQQSYEEGSRQHHLAWDASEAFQSLGHVAVASYLAGTSLEQHQKASFDAGTA
jgi:hypothetical protein